MLGSQPSFSRATAGLLGLTGALLVFAAAPRGAAAQGWIEPLPGRPLPVGGWVVEKTRSQVRVTVDGRVARVELTEWFKNTGGRVAEGEYLYPLPGEAAFAGFSLFQGEQELRGEMMDRDHAREVYEEIVRRRADPALIELVGHGLVRARIFPIEPGEERKVELRYTELLQRSGDALQFRYAGGMRNGEIDRPRRVVPVASEDRPHKEEKSATDFRMDVQDGAAFLDPFSPTHGLTHERQGDRLVIRLDEELAGELSVFLPLAHDGVSLTVAAHHPAGEAGYAMLTLSPGRLDLPAEPRDVTVVLDVSGSMAGEKIEQARAAIAALLGTLERRDRFRLISFSSSVHAQSEGWQPVNDASVQAARAWVDRLDADGGTNIEGALAEAFRVRPGDAQLPVVIFLTDGLPTVGERAPERIAAAAEHDRGRARVFAFGVGHDVNTSLLDGLSAAARGATDYVQPGESVERALSLLTAKIKHPVLTDLVIDGAPVRLREIYPVKVPDLFAGQELVLFARYEGGAEGEISVSGRRGGHDEQFMATASFPRQSDDNAYLPRLWAARKLGYLTRQVWLEGSTASLVKEIKETALRYGLPSEYTAYLVKEPNLVTMGGGGGRPDALGLSALPAAPAEAKGAGAVDAAARARTMREATKASDLNAVADALQSKAESDVRLAAGRLFRQRDGVWVESATTPSDRLPLVTVKLFSRAWFDLLAALPEVAPAARELGRLELAGAAVRIRVDQDGVDRLTPERLATLVHDFRGPATTP